MAYILYNVYVTQSMYMYSGTSLIHTLTIRLLGLSGVKRELLQILINAQNTSIKKKKGQLS